MGGSCDDPTAGEGVERLTPWFAEHDMRLYCGDVAAVLPLLPPESVNCVVTSPPYFGLRDYELPPTRWPAISYRPMPGLPEVDVAEMTCCLGLEPDVPAYVGHLVLIMRQARRVLTRDGIMWLNLGDSYATHQRGSDQGWDKSRLNNPARVQKMTFAAMRMGRHIDWDVPEKNLVGVPWRVAFALQADGWLLRSDVTWFKPNAMPESVADRPSACTEDLFMFARHARYWFDLDPIRAERAEATIARYRYPYQPNGNPASATNHLTSGGMIEHANPAGRNPGNMWTVPTQPYPGTHYATMPAELARRCIAAGCPPGGTVLDMFAGSGTTLMVARRLLRHSVGIEFDADSCRQAVDRVGQPILEFDP